MTIRPPCIVHRPAQRDRPRRSACRCHGCATTTLNMQELRRIRDLGKATSRLAVPPRGRGATPILGYPDSTAQGEMEVAHGRTAGADAPAGMGRPVERPGPRRLSDGGWTRD